MKPDAAEFIPGVSAYAGAMKPKKSKGNKNSKSSPTAAATPTPTAKSGPVTPGLLSGSGPSSPVTRDADVAAGGASSSSQPQPQAKEDRVLEKGYCRGLNNCQYYCGGSLYFLIIFLV